jgi:peptidoglycan/xylan/chitin deacetylase (PgdA/CDA1 family)
MRRARRRAAAMLSVVSFMRVRRWGGFAVVAGVACSSEASAPLAGKQQALGARGAAVTVSLTFDDTLSPQLEAASILEDHGLLGTFYVNSPRLHAGSAGQRAYLSVDDARALADAGHEIGGHTLSHPSLPGLPRLEAEREIVNDRRELARLGLGTRSLAYPYGDFEAQSEALSASVASAGYSNARDTNGFRLDRCDSGPESLPPESMFRLRSVRSVNNVPPASGGQPAPPADTAQTLLGWIDRASECGGGFLPLIFHELRPSCADSDAADGYCFDLAELDALAAALATRTRCWDDGGDERCYDLDVAPVSDALDQAVLPLPDEVFALRNASFERTLASGNTECLERAQGAGGTARFERSTELGHSGVASEHIEIDAPFVAAAEVRIQRDFGACAPFATRGRAYELSLFYRADPGAPAPTLRFVVHRLTGDHAWVQWTTGMPFAAASPGQWVRRSFTTPAVPDGTLALSFGLRLQSTGGVSVDDFAIAAAD